MSSHESDATPVQTPLGKNAQSIFNQIYKTSHLTELRRLRVGPQIARMAARKLINETDISQLEKALSAKKAIFFTPTPVDPPAEITPDQTPPEAASTEVESGDTSWSPSDILAEMERDESHGYTHWTDTYDK